MSTRPAARAAAGAIVAMTISVAGCQWLPATEPVAGPVLTGPSARPAVLAVVLGHGSASTRAELLRVVAGSARTRERLIAVNADGGGPLGSFAAPGPLRMTGPALPAPVGSSATSFQRATYRRELTLALRKRRRDVATLRQQERGELRRWAERAVTRILSAFARSSPRPGGLPQALAEAAAQIASLQQIRPGFGPREVVTILGSEPAVPPALHSSLGGVTAVVADVPTATQESSWRAALAAAGASSAFAFTTLTDDHLAGVVAGGLAGRDGNVFELTGIRFRPAEYELPASAGRALRRALRLLTVTYPDASATICGYTDTVPVPGGNLRLSWRRARAVLDWLVGHGVAPSRLQASGYGSADPAAKNRPGGQPLNRRVILIISASG
jgi:outer membrane protein OmpA-like peptidoglycan-associated protein